MTLVIKDWEKHFENNRTRGMKVTRWVPVPNKMDGLGYTTLVDHPNGAAHLGAWVAIVEIASKQKTRGTLPQEGAGERQDHAGIAQALARISRLPAGIFMEALPRLIEIEWIEQDAGECGETAGSCRETAGIRHLPAQKGREGKGIEGEARVHTAPPPEGQTGDTVDLSGRVHDVAEALFVAHAAAGFTPGSRFDAEQEIVRALQGAVNPEAILDSLLSAHVQFVPHWLARKRARADGYVPPISRFIRDGDYRHPPAALVPPKTSQTREYEIPWEKPEGEAA